MRCAGFTFGEQAKAGSERGLSADMFGEPLRFIPGGIIKTLQCSREVGEWLPQSGTIVRGMKRDDQRQRPRCRDAHCRLGDFYGLGVFSERRPDDSVRGGATSHSAVQIDCDRSAPPLARVYRAVGIEVTVIGNWSEAKAGKCCGGFAYLLRRHEKIRIDVAAQLVAIVQPPCNRSPFEKNALDAAGIQRGNDFSGSFVDDQRLQTREPFCPDIGSAHPEGISNS